MTNHLTMREFGRWGRSGNQFFQYAFLTQYAAEYDLELQLPPWVGNHLFGFEDPPISTNLPTYNERGNGLEHSIPPKGDKLVGKDFRGYAQYHTSYFAPYKNRVRGLFNPVAGVENRLASAVAKLCDTSKDLVGIHLRRGDYGQNIFPIIPTSWYLAWLEKRYRGFNSPKLFIATEDHSLVKDFEQYHPETAETLGIDLASEPMADCTYLSRDLATHDPRAMDWYPDLYLLSKCGVILGPSSTFSFFAAMLAPRLESYWRASLASEGFVQIDPWNAYPQLREHVRDYPHLPGVALRTNPYW